MKDEYALQKAHEMGIPIMTKSWIEDVWRQNAVANVETTLNMMNEYRVPIFYNLKVTASGLSEREKNEIKDSISGNGKLIIFVARWLALKTLRFNYYSCISGGTYTPEMRKETNILILPVGRGEKFRFAERWKTICLSPSWIECCLKKGYAVRFEDFIVKSAEKKCSTPVNTCNSEFSNNTRSL